MSPPTVVLDAGWMVAGVAPGAAASPEALDALHPAWIAAPVPGTVAQALRAAGQPADAETLDGRDWWLRCRFGVPAGRHRLHFEGIATLADAWLNGRHVLQSATMHRGHLLDAELADDNELVVRCAALSPVLAGRRPRPRWKTHMIRDQQLRWVRTSLLGRIPGWAGPPPPPVGLFRPVTLVPADGRTPFAPSLSAVCGRGRTGTVRATWTMPGARAEAVHGMLEVAGQRAPLVARPGPEGAVVEATVTTGDVERWWPHTHGTPRRYEVTAEVAGARHLLGRVGFRTLRVDESAGGFRLVVNGEPVFCRGACWFPPDPESLNAPPAREDHLLELACAAGLNMLRLPGTTVYEGERFYDRCDELGIMVWQDCMFAFMDPPADEAFEAAMEAETAEVLGRLAGHPSLSVVCGNQEVGEIPAMLGLGPERRATPLFDKAIAAVAAAAAPGVPYVPTNPHGGDPPFRMDTGTSQYFGVGGYLRPVEDARRAGVRFATECLAFATPPEPRAVEEWFGGARAAGHDPRWKAAVHHDAGRAWDMEDVRDHYVATLFGTDPLAARYHDAERALELGRAAIAHLVHEVLSEWRRPGSSCDGALVLALADLAPGAGWGLLDAAGRPKAPWYALRRALAPVAVLAVDEGLNGLAVHVVNDTPAALDARLEVALVARGAAVVERGEVAVTVGAHSAATVWAEELLGGWRDATYAYRFAPPAHDAVVCTLRDLQGCVRSQVVHLPLGQARPVEEDLGLRASARRTPGGWVVDLRTARLAQWVAVRLEGAVAADSWFHLPPGATRSVGVWPGPGAGPVVEAPRGTVTALNAAHAVAIEVAG